MTYRNQQLPIIDLPSPSTALAAQRDKNNFNKLNDANEAY